ncbi:MAG TPA: hypothetical protein ENI23_12540 [bacterium]|nr:hypothetical protein [bacterium]
MTNEDSKRCRAKIRKCLTEDFWYGKRKDGKPLKKQKRNESLFDKTFGYAAYCAIGFEEIMNAVDLGLQLASER